MAVQLISAQIGVAEILTHLYTANVNPAKLINAFLALALCFGQVVASAHIADHLHSHEGPISCGADFDYDCESAANSLSSSISALAAGRHDAPAHPHSDEHAEYDCTIFHTLLCFSGIFNDSQQHQPLALQRLEIPSFTVALADNKIRQDHQIRAPPV